MTWPIPDVTGPLVVDAVACSSGSGHPCPYAVQYLCILQTYKGNPIAQDGTFFDEMTLFLRLILIAPHWLGPRLGQKRHVMYNSCMHMSSYTCNDNSPT